MLLARSGGAPSVWWAYALLTSLLALTPFWLTSVPRYMMALFPVVAAYVVAVPERVRVVVSASAVVMGALAFGAFTSVLTFDSAPLAP